MEPIKKFFSFFSIPDVHPLMFQQSQEIIGLLSKNILTSLLIAGLVVMILSTLPAQTRKTAQRIGLAIFLFLPWMVRLICDGYAYDTPLALLSQLSDILIFTYGCFLLGQTLTGLSSPVAKVSVGIAILTLLGLLFTFLGLNGISPQPSFVTNFIFVSVMAYLILKKVPDDPVKIHAKQYSTAFFAVLLFAYCCSHFLLVPSPPDADMTSVGEMLGYLFQGQNLNKVATGFGEEWVLRYPAGFPSLAYIISHLLNIRASEA